MTTTTAPATTACTVVVTASGGRCGAPAVRTFTGRTGAEFAECAAHTSGHVATREAVAVGATVRVRHAGLVKAGRVVTATPTFVTVEVHTHKGVKAVRVRREELVA